MTTPAWAREARARSAWTSRRTSRANARCPATSAPIGDIPDQLPSLISLSRDRDLVFIDQRGTGGSNGLSCPAPPDTLAGKSLVRRSIQSCLDSLRGRADLHFYTSAMAAGDTAQVLSALGSGRLNLLGGSYGVTHA